MRRSDAKPHWTKTYSVNFYDKDIEMIDAAREKMAEELGKSVSRSKLIGHVLREHLGYSLKGE